MPGLLNKDLKCSYAKFIENGGKLMKINFYFGWLEVSYLTTVLGKDCMISLGVYSREYFKRKKAKKEVRPWK